MAHPVDNINNSAVLDGLALLIGGLYWPRPEPPLGPERAALIARHIPAGTIASGITAGWVWTGLGQPTPFQLIAKTHPSPSPLLRHQWNIRSRHVPPENIVVRRGLTLTSPEQTASDLWRVEGPDDIAAAQLFFLHEENSTPPADAISKRVELVAKWRADYPWATR
jgi:hypothetical protein